MTKCLMESLTPNLMVEDVLSSIDYYQKFFNFDVLMKFPEDEKPVWALLQNSNVTIMLQQKDSLAEEYRHLAKRPLGGSLSLFIKITDLDNFYKKIKSDVKIIKGIHTTPYNMKEFAVEDPDGYLLVLAQDL